MQGLHYFNFSWDPAKAASNVAKHGIEFSKAADVFKDPQAISIQDDEHSQTELRWITMGLISTGTVVVVAHTYHEDVNGSVDIRIISARPATPSERRKFQEKP
jgi:uncharacterized protein